MKFIAKLDPDDCVKVMEYPDMIKGFFEKTGFDNLVFPNDIIIYGYAAKLLKYMLRSEKASMLKKVS